MTSPKTPFPTSETNVVGRIAETAHEIVDQTTAKVGTVAADATDAIAARASQLQAKQQQAVAACREGIRSNPFAAIGAAIAAGWLVGRLARGHNQHAKHR